MKKFVLLLLFLSAAAMAQELTVPVKFMSNYKAGAQQYIGTDNLGAQYTIQDNEFRKHTEGVTLKFRALQLGNIYRVDLQNPLQIVLFYKKFNTVVLLDNQLNEISRINFSDTPEHLIPEAIGLASQNRLWLYDINTQRLGLYDLAQNSFKTITPPFTDTIKYYQNDYNYFYWIDSLGRCYAANLFGKVTLLGTVPPNDGVYLASSTQALIRIGNVLYLHNMQEGTRRHVAIVEKSFNGFGYSAQILSIFTGTEINTYKIILPE